MSKYIALPLTVFRYAWGHVIFGWLIIMMWHSLANRGYTIASPTETAGMMLGYGVWLGVVRLFLIFIDVKGVLRPGVGLIIYWVAFGWVFTKYGHAIIDINDNLASFLLLSLAYIAFHLSDVGVWMIFNRFERWWDRHMEDDTPYSLPQLFMRSTWRLPRDGT